MTRQWVLRRHGAEHVLLMYVKNIGVVQREERDSRFDAGHEVHIPEAELRRLEDGWTTAARCLFWCREN